MVPCTIKDAGISMGTNSRHLNEPAFNIPPRWLSVWIASHKVSLLSQGDTATMKNCRKKVLDPEDHLR